MKWEGRRKSTNFEDHRGGMSKKMGGGIIGIILLLVGAYFGVDLSGVAPLLEGGNTVVSNQPVQESAQEERLREFSQTVLAETENTWGRLFAQSGKNYIQPVMVAYRDRDNTGCGLGQAAMGPFYCPADQRVYLDFSFYNDMKTQLKADGEFAWAYVIAHEVGHHVQNLLGISRQTQMAQQQQTDQVSANKISVLVELQADCFAGVWAHDVQGQGLLEAGDVEKAFNAAQAVGDDRLQQKSQGRIIPDAFTHGSSAQRLAWFKKGLQSGDPRACDTFDGQIRYW